MTAGLSIVLNVGLERVNPGFVYFAPASTSQCDASIQSTLRTAQSTWAATSSSSSSSSSGLSHNAKVAIGVAVGVGVPVLLLAVLCVALGCRAADQRKRLQTRSAAPAKRHASDLRKDAYATDSDATSVSHRSAVELELGAASP